MQVDKSIEVQVSVCFGERLVANSIGSIIFDNPIGKIIFHVLETPIPFLLCFANIDRMVVYFKTSRTRSLKETQVPEIQKWGHPQFFLNRLEDRIKFITEGELRRIHRRFGHTITKLLVFLLKKV